MNVVLCTAHDAQYASLAAITFPTVKRYCEKHGYGLIYDAAVGPTRKDACKIDLYNAAYNDGRFGPNDVFAWIDTDAIIANSNIRIDHIVRWMMPRSTHYLIGVDLNGLNTGFFIARFSEEARTFMTVAAAISSASGWADQEGLIQTAVKSPHKEIYKEVPGKVFNCNLYAEKGWEWTGEAGNYINRYEPGDFVLHAAGIEEPRRSELLRHYASVAT